MSNNAIGTGPLAGQERKELQIDAVVGEEASEEPLDWTLAN